MKDGVACTFIFFVEIGFVFRVPHRSLCSLCEASGYKIEKNALDGCPGIEKEGRLKRRKSMGSFLQIQAVIHGSPIGKAYPSSVSSLRSLDFSNLAN